MRSLKRTVPTDLPTTRERFSAALAEQGFGVLSDIDVQAIFETKLGAKHEPHRILGVCNPQFAKQALDMDRDIALLLPCTATLREIDGETEVAILDPEHAFTLADEATRERLAPLASEVRERLSAALQALASS
ncbi:MAG: DUF302 domain-containing protein [Trueperaceae bacterium]|nr:DUF302 domain-containing protein [Trueperaceae bacterium]